MTDHSPLSAVSTWMTFFVQIACGYLLTRVLSALCRSHQVRLRLWTSFLLLTVSGWIFLSVPRPVVGSAAIFTPVAQGTMPTHWSWTLSNSWVQALDRLGIWAAWIYGVVLAVLLLQLLAQRNRRAYRCLVQGRHIRRWRRGRSVENILQYPFASQNGGSARRVRRDRQDTALGQHAAAIGP